MELKASNLQIKKSLNGDTELIFSVADKDNKIAKLISEDTTLKEFIRLRFEKWRNKRSLNANAYFHLLVNKIAEKLKVSDSEVKIRLNLEYGTPATDKNGNTVVIKLPKDVDIKQFYDYAKWIADKREPSGVETSYYIFYKQTHTLDTKEMSRLIDGTIQEAQALGIDTITPAEKEKMMKLYGVYYEKQANKVS